jgi:predicted transcriptional regulator of viral defense system
MNSPKKRVEKRFNLSISDRLVTVKLARAARHGLIDIPSSSKALEFSPLKTAVRLGALARRGWLLRVRRGLYYVLPLEAEPGKPVTIDDPWVLAREIFSPCYIGGWSAAEYWNLTEQIFRSTLVVTSSNIRSRSVRLLGHEFRLFWVPKEKTKGALLVWRGAERIPVSDRERTIIDSLRHPELCGGIRHVAHVMREYGRSKERNMPKLISVAEETATGAAWKRLGYLAEVLWPKEKALIKESTRHLAAGYVKLDPTVKKNGTMLRRWRLRVNVTLANALGES